MSATQLPAADPATGREAVTSSVWEDAYRLSPGAKSLVTLFGAERPPPLSERRLRFCAQAPVHAARYSEVDRARLLRVA